MRRLILALKAVGAFVASCMVSAALAQVPAPVPAPVLDFVVVDNLGTCR